MKKFVLLLTVLLSISLFACSKPKKEGILEDTQNNYYITSEDTYWKATNKSKLTAISLDDNTLYLSDLELGNNVKYLYKGNVKLTSEATFIITHLGRKVNGGLSFEIVTTNEPNDMSTYKKLTSSGDKYISLTPDTLYDFDEEEIFNGCVGKNDGYYTLIFAVYENNKKASYGVGLLPCTESEFTQTPEKTPTVEHKHQYSGFLSNETHHWQKCECGEETDAVAHSGGTATSTEKAKCEVCGKEYGSLKEPTPEKTPTTEHKHQYSGFISNGTHHWQKCECGEETDAVAHSGGTATSTEKAKCEVCGKEYGKLKEPTPETTYTITFDNMGFGSMPEPITNATIIPNDLPTLTHEGYEFINWYLNEECTDLVKPGLELTSNITLYAKWKEKIDDPSQNENLSYGGEDILPSSYTLATTVQEGLILHAWNWSYSNIEANLENIARSGYTTIQVSPVQQPKDYDPKYPKGWAEQWWKFYQPISYSIAQTSWLGSKADLTSLCAAADEYGIKIIADIVANHSANVSDVGTSNQSTPHKTLADYESALYTGRSKYFRSFITNNDSSIQAVVQGSIGMPDLKTEDTFVQNMIIDLLKECIDCGIDGFRFDAAKHIETPDDGQYASQFWPNVLDATTNYANSKNVKLYYYGEILNTCGNGRNFSSYTKYMSITDNKTGNNIRNAIVGKNASGAATSSYQTGQAANKLVLWAESHDTYANTEQESTNVSQENINKTWAMVASRKDATALYFARPGEVGSIGTWAWMSTEVSAINNFHNQFIGTNETLYNNGNFAVVERYSNDKCGLVIVNCNGNASSVSFATKNIKNGEYIDQITGNKFTVNNGTIKGNIGSTGIAVISNITSANAPIASLSQAGGYFDSNLTITIDLSFATSARIKYGSEEKIITDDSSISIGSGMKYGDSIEVEVSAINEKYRVTKTYKFIKLQGVTANSVVVSNVPERYASGSTYDVYAWVWQSGKDGRLVKTSLNGTYIVFDVNSNEDNFLLLTVGKGTSGINSQTVWQYAVKKTNDFIISPNAIYEAPNDIWVNAK